MSTMDNYMNRCMYVWLSTVLVVLLLLAEVESCVLVSYHPIAVWETLLVSHFLT